MSKTARNICYIIGNDGTYYSCKWSGQPVGVRRIAPELTRTELDHLDKHQTGKCNQYLYEVLSRRFGLSAEKLAKAPYEVIARCSAGQVVRILV